MNPIRLHFELEPGADPGSVIEALKVSFAQRLPQITIDDVEIPELRSLGEKIGAVVVVLHLLLLGGEVMHSAHVRQEWNRAIQEIRMVSEEMRKSSIPVPEPKLECGPELIPLQDVTEQHLEQLP